MGRGSVAQEWDGYRSMGGDQLHCASLVLYTVLIVVLLSLLILFSFLFYSNKLPLSQPQDFNFLFLFFFPGSVPYPTGVCVCVSKWLCGAYLLARLNHSSCQLSHLLGDINKIPYVLKLSMKLLKYRSRDRFRSLQMVLRPFQRRLKFSQKLWSIGLFLTLTPTQGFCCSSHVLLKELMETGKSPP